MKTKQRIEEYLARAEEQVSRTKNRAAKKTWQKIADNYRALATSSQQRKP